MAGVWGLIFKYLVNGGEGLNLAVMLMEKEMKKLNADIKFAYYPDNHFTVVTTEYKKVWEDFLLHRYLEWQKTKER